MDFNTLFTKSHQVKPIDSLLEQLLPLPADFSGAVASDRQITDCQLWLSEHQVWGELPSEILQAIAQSLHFFEVASETQIYQEGQIPIGLYLLKTGTVATFRQTPIGQSLIHYRHVGNLFGYKDVNADDYSYHTSSIALTASEIYFLSNGSFQKLIEAYPAIQQIMNSTIAAELEEFTSRIAWQEQRIQCLKSYTQSVPSQPNIIGNGKAAQKLESQVKQAAATLQPVIFQAEEGTGKTFLAGLIHARSELATQPFAKIDCAKLSRAEDGRIDTDVLFGRIGKQAGLLQLLERGTLLLDNVHLLSKGDRARLAHYLNQGLILPNHSLVGKINPEAKPPQAVPSSVRLILASPQKLDLSDINNALTIKLFPLTQRRSDIRDFANYFLKQFCEQQNRPLLQIDQSDLRRLLSYDYPANIAELAEILHRAVIMTPAGHWIIPEQALWSVQSHKNSFRLDLLTHIPNLRKILLSHWYPEGIWIVMMAIFVPVSILGFLGDQDREHSVTLNLFWTWWWPVSLLLLPLVGRFWCAVCPFMITSEWLRRISLWLFPRKQLNWNTQWLNRWGDWIIFAGFVIIYLWEKIWDLPHQAYLSAWLLLAITAWAVIFSQIYERRLWCRYLCPIGGMKAMFAKLAIVELRSVQQMCASHCNTFGCYKGSAPTPITYVDALPNEGQAGNGCPLYSHPAQLQDNRNCMYCMTCLKSCPNRSAQLNLRFPALDLVLDHQGFWAEAALLLLLLGGVFMHHTHDLLTWMGFGDIAIEPDHLLLSLPIILAVLSIPTLLTYNTHAIARFLDREQPDYLKVIYAYLPLTLAANLAHYMPAFITEAGKVLPIAAHAVGLNGIALPTLTWGLEVAQFLQGCILLSALAFSPYILFKITKRSWLSNLPHLLLMGGLTTLFFKLMI